MTLQQLSNQYTQEAQALHTRIVFLRQEHLHCADPLEAKALQRRISDLEPLQRQSRQLADLTAHYYDRGYRRNAQYTL